MYLAVFHVKSLVLRLSITLLATVFLLMFVSELMSSEDGRILKRSPEETCHSCHKTDSNAPSDPDSIKTHNSITTGSTKWGGSWGVTGGKYGPIVCTTCHTAHGTSNIYLIRQSFKTPDGSNWESSGESTTPSVSAGYLDFRYKEGYDPANVRQGVMGRDNEVREASTRACEACHTYASSGQNGVSKHAYTMSAAVGHNGTQACTNCHSHKGGFKASCNACHGNPPLDISTLAHSPAQPTGSQTAGAHNAHVNNNGIVCLACHANSVGAGATHNDQSVTVGFSLFNGAYLGGIYDGQTTANYDVSEPNTSVSKTGSKVCSNIYCHGYTMGDNDGTDTTPQWDNPATAACGTCHGATSDNPPLLGSHFMHTAEFFNSLYWGYSYNCGICHKDPVVDGSLHVNNKSEIVFSSTDPKTVGGTYSGTDTMLDAYGTCNNVYCHSTAQSSPPGGAPTYRETPVWGTTYSMGLECDSCHYYYDSAPQLATGSHAKHFEYGWWGLGAGSECAPCHNYYQADESYSCAECHTDGAFVPATANHVNHAVEVRFGPVYGGPTLRGSYSGTPAPGDAYGHCSNIYCHSNGTGGTSQTGETRGIADNITPDWGSGPTTCSSCHGSPPGYSNGVPKANSHPMHSCVSCEKCHWPTTHTGNTIASYSNHVNRRYNIGNSSATLTYSYNVAGGSCSGTFGCHGNAQWGNSLTVDSSNCLACHKTAKGSRRQIVDSNGDGTGTGGDFKKASHHVVTQITNSGSGAVTVGSPTTNTAGSPAGFTTPGNAYTLNSSYATCTVRGTTLSGNNHFYNNFGISLLGNTQTITKVEVGATAFYTAPHASTARLYLQVSWDGGTTWSAEQYVALPINTASTQFKTFTSSTTWTAAKLSDSNFKVRVRSYSTNGYPADTITNNLDWIQVRVTYDYITIVNTPLSSTACLVCHEMTQHLCGSVRLKDADTGAVYVYDPNNPASAENFCLSCHDSNGANGNMSPFADGATLGVIPYMTGKDITTYWQKTYGHKQKGLTCLGNGNPDTGCHSNGHGSDNVGLLSKNMTLPELDGYWYSSAEEYKYTLCFSCHQNYPRITKEAMLGYRLGGNYDVLGDGAPPYNIPNITTKFRDQNHPVNTGKPYDDPTYFTGYSNLHYWHLQTADAWQYRGSINSSVNCLSCHNVHGSNTQWGWVYDELQYNHYSGTGSDQYGKIGGNLDSLTNYPTNCAYNCHTIMRDYDGVYPTYNWFEPAGE